MPAEEEEEKGEAVLDLLRTAASTANTQMLETLKPRTARSLDSPESTQPISSDSALGSYIQPRPKTGLSRKRKSRLAIWWLCRCAAEAADVHKVLWWCLCTTCMRTIYQTTTNEDCSKRIEIDGESLLYLKIPGAKGRN